MDRKPFEPWSFEENETLSWNRRNRTEKRIPWHVHLFFRSLCVELNQQEADLEQLGLESRNLLLFHQR